MGWIHACSTSSSAKASAPEAAASATGETLVPADESTVMGANACPMETMTLRFANPSLTWHYHILGSENNEEQEENNQTFPPHHRCLRRP